MQGSVFVSEVSNGETVAKVVIFQRTEKPLEQVDYSTRCMLTEDGEKVYDSGTFSISKVSEKVPLNPRCNPNVEAV